MAVLCEYKHRTHWIVDCIYAECSITRRGPLPRDHGERTSRLWGNVLRRRCEFAVPEL